MVISASWIRWTCKAIVWIAEKALDAAKWTVNQASHALDLAKDALTAAEGILDGAEGALTLAEDFLEGVKEACELALAVEETIFKYGLDDLIDITDISFDTKLSEAHVGSFDVSLTAKILRATKRLDLYINLNSIASICKELAEHIGEGFGKFF